MNENLFVSMLLCLCVVWIALVIGVMYWLGFT